MDASSSLVVVCLAISVCTVQINEFIVHLCTNHVPERVPKLMEASPTLLMETIEKLRAGVHSTGKTLKSEKKNIAVVKIDNQRHYNHIVLTFNNPMNTIQSHPPKCQESIISKALSFLNN